jgi:glycerol-3-phosphate O-acyltransferase / dihydroxyacetone phosphate acyltransferase
LGPSGWAQPMGSAGSTLCYLQWQMRAVLVALCRLLLRVFFRRVEVVGGERVPGDGPVMFTLNHPNGLIDPLFILCLSSRPVSFLAKAPLFRTPLVGWFVRTFECLPVYRKQDGNDPAKNREIIERSVELLRSGNAIAIFPEGTSH